MTEINNLAQSTVDLPIKPKKLPPIFPYLAVIALALLSGFALSRFLPASTGSSSTSENSSKPISTEDLGNEDVKVGVSYGSTTQEFKDEAEGTLEAGGLDGEGTHHLIRPGGDSQTIYLTSSVVDLSLFVGRKVKVKGETFTPQNAGWFMDVGVITALE